MTAILCVPEGSCYAPFNGGEYPIVSINECMVSLKIEGATVDFLPKEVSVLRVTKYEWWFNWRSQVGGKLSSFENAILDAYRLAGAGNRLALDAAFPDFFVNKIYLNSPQGL